MVTVACALLGIGYLVFYVAGSNLAHGPGKGVGFVEAIGLSTPPAAKPSPSSTGSPARTSPTSTTAPKPGTTSGGGK